MKPHPLYLAGIVVLLASCGRDAPQPPSVPAVHGAWVRLAAVPGRPGAAYFTIGGGSRADALVAVTSPEVATIELHESMAGAGGMAGMQPLKAAPLPAGGTLAFAPGGRHAMLFGVAPSVRPGGVIELHFTLASGRTLDAAARAVAAGDPAPGGE